MPEEPLSYTPETKQAVPKLSPIEAFHQGLELVPPEKLPKGAYTEIHFSHDQVFVVPEIMDQATSRASVDGYHSMFDAGQNFRSLMDQKQLAILDNLPFDSTSVVAKGDLKLDEKGELVLEVPRNAIRRQAYREASGKDVDAEMELLAKLTELKGQLGITEIVDARTRKSIEVIINEGHAPKLSKEVDWHTPPSSEDDQAGPIFNGVARRMYYSDYQRGKHAARIERETPTGKTIELQDRAEIDFDVYEANKRTHQEAMAKFYPEATPEEIEALINSREVLEIGDQSYEIQGRHTIDQTNNQAQLNLIVRGQPPTERGPLNGFEYAYFAAYLNTLSANHPPIDNGNLSLITTYLTPGQPPVFRRLEMSAVELHQGSLQDQDFLYNQLANRR